MNNKTKLKFKLFLDIVTFSFGKMFNDKYLDPVTNCLNRKAFESASYSEIAIVDMDSLKYINDTIGHQEGDKYLKSLSNSLMELFGESNVYRLGGDEFAVVNDPNISSTDFHYKLILSCEINKTHSYGVGRTLKEADLDLNTSKQIREEMGLRASRGECPPWMRIAPSNVIPLSSAVRIKG